MNQSKELLNNFAFGRPRPYLRHILLASSFLVLLSARVGFSQDDVSFKLNVLDAQLRTHVQSQNYKEALSVAASIVELIQRAKGPSSLDASKAYSNLGSIQRVLGRHEEAAVSFSKALNIRKAIAPDDLVNQISLYESVGFSFSATGNDGEAEEFYSAGLELLEKTNNANSRGAFSIVLGAATNAAKRKDLVKAHALFKRAAQLSYQHFEVDSLERVDLLESYTCNVVAPYPNSVMVEEYREVEKDLKEKESGQKRVIHGKALSIRRPDYSPFARAARLSGTVYVRIGINAEGKVVRAKAICSNEILGKSAEVAALSAAFSPTMKDGNPIPIEGLLTYNFIAP